MASPVAGRPLAVVEHQAHGRLRARVRREARTAETMAGIRRHLEGHMAIDSVEVNRQSGSVLACGADHAAVRAALEEVLQLVEPFVDGDRADDRVAAAVALVRECDRRLRATTGGRVSLRWLVPAALLTAGIRQMMAQGLALGSVPWIVLLYYGVDSFLKLYPEHAPRAESGRS